MNPERAVTRLKKVSPDRLPGLAAELVQAVLEHAAADHDYEADGNAWRMVEAIRSFEEGDVTIHGLRKAAKDATTTAIGLRQDGILARVETTAALAGEAATEAAVDYDAVAAVVARIVDLARTLGVSESVLTDICVDAEDN